MSNDVHLEADFTLNTQPDIQADFYINMFKWGDIQGDIADQTDLTDLIDTKIEIEATARENNDLALQNGINTLNNDLTAEISNRGTADGILQNNIDTLSGTVTSNYNTLDGKIGDNKTAIDNHIADKSNPHDVSKAQVGLGNVDNTSDLNKPISTATQNALNGKANTSDLSTVATTGDYDDLSNKPTIPTVNDATLTIQKNGSNVATFTANSSTNQTANITVPTQASDIGALPDTTTINDLTTAEQQSAINSGANTTNIGQIATNTQNISNEVTNRQNADNALQSQIDALVVASDVFDIVGTYAELQAYDISTVPVNDIIKVLVDSTHNNAATYYRCVENDNVKSWSYIGAEGAYYTKSEADGRFVEQTTTVNGQALSGNITLTASDVGALPDSTTIGNGTLTIQKNGSTIDTFGANDTGNTTVNITVPTDTSDLTNDSNFISNTATGNASLTVQGTATSQSGSINIGALSSATDIFCTVVGASASASKDNTVAVGCNAKANDTSATAIGSTAEASGLISTAIGSTAKATGIFAIQIGSGTNSTNQSMAVGFGTDKEYQLLNGTTGLIPDARISSNIARTSAIPTVGNGTITITQGGTTKGTFTTNQSGNSTIDLDAGGGGTATDVQINGISITSNDVANIITESAYNSSTNKIATMSDVPAAQVQSNWNETDTTSKAYIQNKPSLSTVATTGDYDDLTNKPTLFSGNYNDLSNKPSLSTVATTGDYDDLTNKPTIPAAQVNSDWNASSGVAQILNKPTIPAVGDGTITITQGGTTKGTFTTNQSGNTTIDLDAGGGSSTDVQINGTSITSGGVANIVTEGIYDASTNKIATMSDLADKQDVLTAGTNISIVSAPPIPPVDTRSTATVSTVGSTTWQEVAYCNGKYIAVGNNGYVVISTDGETWGTPFTVGTAKWRGITYGNGKYVICGSDRQIAYTTDLANWTSVTVGESGSNREWMDVIYANNKFYAISNWGALTTSTNGETWETPTIINNNANLQAIIYANGKYIIVTRNASIFTSSDSINWIAVSSPSGIGQINAITYAFGKYIIAGQYGSMSYSTDGATWATPFRVGTNDWQELVLGNGYIVAVGNNGNTSKSTDGINWETPRTIGQYSWYGLACNGNDYVAVGTNSKVTNFEIAPEQDGGTVINGAEIVSAVDSTSTDSQCVGAKLFYDTVGDIETALNTINSGVSA